jgi:hypothetical protein
MTYHRICNKSNIYGATSGAGTVFVTHAVEKSTCNDTLMPFLAMFSKKGYGCK